MNSIASTELNYHSQNPYSTLFTYKDGLYWEQPQSVTYRANEKGMKYLRVTFKKCTQILRKNRQNFKVLYVRSIFCFDP